MFFIYIRVPIKNIGHNAYTEIINKNNLENYQLCSQNQSHKMLALAEVNLVMILFTKFVVSCSDLMKAVTSSSSLITPSYKELYFVSLFCFSSPDQCPSLSSTCQQTENMKTNHISKVEYMISHESGFIYSTCRGQRVKHQPIFSLFFLS